MDYDVDVLIIGGGGAGCFGGDRSRQRGRERADRHKAPHGRREHDDGRGRHSGGGQAERLSRAALSGRLRRRTLRGANRSFCIKLVTEAPEAIQVAVRPRRRCLIKTPDGTMITTHGGGTSRKRMHAAKDYSGAEIMRTLRDEVLNREHPGRRLHVGHRAHQGRKRQRCAGAVLHEHGDGASFMIARAKTVIIATGGAGRLHYQGFPTSNHYGATADGLILGIPRGRKASLSGYAPVPPHGRCLPGADLRRARDGKGPFGRRDARELRRRGVHASARDARRGGGFHHPRMLRAAQGRQDPAGRRQYGSIRR